MTHPTWHTDLYRRLRAHLDSVRMIDTHEHLEFERQLPVPEQITLGRLLGLLTSSDLVSAGMPPADMRRAMDYSSGLSPRERWALIDPWYPLVKNTVYFEVLRIAMRDLYGIEDFSAVTVEPLTEAMQRTIRPGITRTIFDKAGIDFAMNNPFGPEPIFRPTHEAEEFLVDMHDCFTEFLFTTMEEQTGINIGCLDDYLQIIDLFFERYGHIAGAYKVGRAYDRILDFEDVPKDQVEKVFLRLLAFNDRPDRREIKALEDYILHYVCRKCGEYKLRMKFHTGHQEGNCNYITNSHPSLLINLFIKYPHTNFDIYHIGYPYHEEVTSIVKTFPNVTVNFCFAYLANATAARHALSGMLDTVPVGKIHGFGGDYLNIEGTYGAAELAKREITRVLCEKVEEGRFSEEEAARIATLILRDNALRNFELEPKREAFREWVKVTYGKVAANAGV